MPARRGVRAPQRHTVADSTAPRDTSARQVAEARAASTRGFSRRLRIRLLRLTTTCRANGREKKTALAGEKCPPIVAEKSPAAWADGGAALNRAGTGA